MIYWIGNILASFKIFNAVTFLYIFFISSSSYVSEDCHLFLALPTVILSYIIFVMVSCFVSLSIGSYSQSPLITSWNTSRISTISFLICKLWIVRTLTFNLFFWYRTMGPSNIRDLLTTFTPSLDFFAISSGDGRIKVLETWLLKRLGIKNGGEGIWGIWTYFHTVSLQEW